MSEHATLRLKEHRELDLVGLSYHLAADLSRRKKRRSRSKRRGQSPASSMDYWNSLRCQVGKRELQKLCHGPGCP